MTVARDDHNVSTDDMAQNKSKLTTDAIAGAGKHDAEPQLSEDTQGSARAQDRRESSGVPLEPLFDDNVDHDFRARWREIQTGFVDEPRHAVEQADELVAELMQRLAQSFSEQRTNLEHQWDASDEVSTEELRVALTRYRSFFERLLSV
jgi:hypothetical protein